MCPRNIIRYLHRMVRPSKTLENYFQIGQNKIRITRFIIILLCSPAGIYQLIPHRGDQFPFFIPQVSDWRFPYKRSHHPVCIHAGQVLTEFVLKECDEGVQPGTELYVFPQAISCKCHTCKSSEAACEGYRYKDFQFISPDQV